MLKIIRSATFKKEFANIGGYETTNIGEIIAET
jgi:putative molybdopterin biosynthesis protein